MQSTLRSDTSEVSHEFPSSNPEGRRDRASVKELHGTVDQRSGLLFDESLKRLARLSGAIDRGLAVRLVRLRSTLGFRRLGYSCFGDYVRQRIDLAERTAHEMARLGHALQRLPLLDRALGDGMLTWTAAVQVARVASASDEAGWLKRAARCSVRELRTAVDDALSARAQSSHSGEHGREPRIDPEADDPCVKLSIRCSPRAYRLWAAALELCSLMADAPLGEAEACEYLLADFLSGADPVEDDFRAYPSEPPIQHGARPQSSNGRRPKQGHRRENPGSSQVDLAAMKLSPETVRVFDVLEQDPPSDPFALDSGLRALIAARRSVDLDLARMLRIVRQQGLARRMGFSNFSEYVEERLAISVHRANFLVRLDRALTGLEATRRAILSGQIGTVAALLISRVVATNSEQAWIDRASRVTVLRLRQEVRWAERESAIRPFNTMPPSPGPLPSELQTLTVALLAEVAPRAHAFEGASAWLRESDSSSDGASDGASDRADDSTVASSCEMFAHGDLDGDEARAQAARIHREMFADEGNARKRVRLEFWLRRSALSLRTEARRWMAAATGSDHVEDRQVLYDVALSFLLTHIRPWLEAVECGDPIAVRDRFHCQIPGCTMQVGSGHHIRFVSQSGPDEPWNLLFVCWTHHILGIHGGGWVRVSGRAPDALRAELGVGRDGRALESWTRGRVTPRSEQAVA